MLLILSLAELEFDGTGKFNAINLGGVSKSAWPGGGLLCVQKSLTDGNFNGKTLYCDAGYTLTGGSCVWRSDGNDQFVYNRPNGNDWFCVDNNYPYVSEIWAICCKIE